MGVCSLLAILRQILPHRERQPSHSWVSILLFWSGSGLEQSTGLSLSPPPSQPDRLTPFEVTEAVLGKVIAYLVTSWFQL